MKHTLLTLFLLFQFLLVKSQHLIQFETGEWDEIIEQASDEQKLIYFGITTEWSKPCQNFIEYVYSDKNVSDYFNSHFINVNRNLEDQTAKEFVSRYGIRSYPAHLFFDSKGKLLHMMKGTMPTDVFLSKCEKVYDPKFQFFTIREKLREGKELSFDEYLNYCSSAFDLGIKDKDAFEGFIKKLKAEDLDNPQVMDVICHSLYHSNVKDEAFAFYIEHYKIISSYIERKNLQNIYTQFIKNTLSYHLLEKKTAVFEKDMYVLKQYLPAEYTVKSAFIYEPKFYLSTGDNQTAFYRINQNFMAAQKIGGHEIVGYCNDWAWMIFNSSDNTSELKSALKWVEYGLSQDHNKLDMMDTQAHLYYKLGLMDQAELIAKEVKLQSENTGRTTDKIDALLKNIKLN
ncbi:thioredoxin family protein [Flammeovirga pacifica]|uniref:Thioredoxin-like fold domain-containing protein n=1 Tax=Flammeovirga pacifica TaxID=915059 RepID=A0A1S1YZ70_FLAPC|nr:thioredoxin family protein [Flammeovirga pacifica]OHX66298.1 hypothetical protein NH26_08000 [Flammeovirga pacifica]